MRQPRSLKLALVASLVLASLQAHADGPAAEVCYTPASVATSQPVGTPKSFRALNDEDKFKCARAGEKTLNELAGDGWRIVQVIPVVVGGRGAWQVVIER